MIYDFVCLFIEAFIGHSMPQNDKKIYILAVSICHMDDIKMYFLSFAI